MNEREAYISPLDKELHQMLKAPDLSSVVVQPIEPQHRYTRYRYVFSSPYLSAPESVLGVWWPYDNTFASPRPNGEFHFHKFHFEHKAVAIKELSDIRFKLIQDLKLKLEALRTAPL